MLAIVIPYFKKTFFNETLDSLSNQTDKRFKVYIGDDASLQPPNSLIEKYQDHFDFEYKRFKTNLGANYLTRHWDRCIAMTHTEEWIMILGDDDILGFNVVQKFYKNLKEINRLSINVVKFSSQEINAKTKPISNIYINKKVLKSTEAFYRRVNNISRSSLSEHIFRREAYEEKGFKDYELGWSADDMAWLQFSNFNNIYCINDAKIFIRVSKKSISGMSAHREKKLRSSFQIFYDIIHNYFSHFDRKHKNLIIRMYEGILIVIEGKTFKNFLKIAYLFLKNIFLYSFFKFTYRFFFKK